MNTLLIPANNRTLLRVVAGLALFCAGPALAGSLDPPGPPAPTMKPLTWVEGRIPVEWLPGSPDALHVISQPGSYYLTANLAGESGRGGIFIDADNVTLDLNGFSLHGADGGSGIFAFNPLRMVTVKNGTLRGWGGHGIGLPSCASCRVEDLLVESTGGDGYFSSIFLGPRAQVRHCTTRGNNSGAGIVVQDGSLIEDCFSGNNSRGYELSGGFNTILRSQAINNWDRGIWMQAAGVVSECVIQWGGGAGILVSQDALVSRNTAWSSGTGVFLEWSRNLVQDNHLHNAGNAGVTVAGGAHSSVIRRNQVSLGWNAGIQTTDADTNLIISNSATGMPTPYTGPGVYGIILDFTGGTTITDGSPWANLVH